MKYCQVEGCSSPGVKCILTGGGVQMYRCEILTGGGVQFYRCEILPDRWRGADLQV